MHHKNNRFSTANHNNPQHYKANNNIPSMPSPGGASTQKRSSVLSKIRDKFKEKPATPQEVAQLKLDAQREVYKTQKVNAKRSRPSRFENIFGGGGGQPSGRSSRGSRRTSSEPSFLFGGGGGESMGGGMFGSSGEGPSLDMFKWKTEKPKRQKNNQEFGSGLKDLF